MKSEVLESRTCRVCGKIFLINRERKDQTCCKEHSKLWRKFYNKCYFFKRYYSDEEFQERLRKQARDYWRKEHEEKSS